MEWRRASEVQCGAGDGYLAAITNFRYIANAVWTTEEAVKRIAGKT